MSLSPRRLAGLAIGLAAAALLLVVAATRPAPAIAATPKAKSCPAQRGTIAKRPLGRVWHRGTSLYACTVVYGRKPRTVRLGPWAPGARVVWDGVTAAWTVPLRRHGVRGDRAWAASAEDGMRWLAGTRLVPGSKTAPSRDGRISAIRLKGDGAAWVTTDGHVVLALHAPESPPEAVGTPPVPLRAFKQLLLIGQWPDVPVATLVGTLSLTVGDGEGDECGGSNPYTLTVRPDAAAAPVGATWWGAWQRTDCG
jgi:hypothetical protein